MARPFSLVALALSACSVTLVPAFELPMDGGSGDGGVDGGGGPSVTAVSAAHEATAVLRDGQLFAWGTGDAMYGETALGPRAMGAGPFVAVALGWSAVCATDAAGAAWCRGTNTDGELGQGNTSPSATLVKVPLPAPVKRLSLTHYHACAVLTDARLYCWGRGTEGQLGQGNGNSRTAPVQVSGAWRDVAAGDGHTCALASDGRAWCWGRNTTGEVGQGAVVPQRYDTPQQVSTGPLLTVLEATMFATCGLDAAGAIWCWGKRQDVQGAPNPSVDYLTPTKLDPNDGWSGMSASLFHICAKKADASVWCLGQNADADLGLGDQMFRATFVRVADAVDQVSAGRFHTCLTRAGRLWCAGKNASGQLGFSDTNPRSVFTEVSFP